MKKTKTRPWDPAEHLETEEDMAAYLDVALEYGDADLIRAAKEDIARAKSDRSPERRVMTARRSQRT